MDKSKLKWRYAYMNYWMDSPDIDTGKFVPLRVCAHGYDEQGEIRSTLYCTADGRFFHRDPKRGWMQLAPRILKGKIKAPSRGGNTGSAQMVSYGSLYCHKLVCTAFHGPCPKGCESDHINGDHSDYSADNLRWVTPAENRRCANYLRRLRKAGIQPKWLHHSTLLSLYQLQWDTFERVLTAFRQEYLGDPMPLSVQAIESDLLRAYNRVIAFS